jgi:hypothetical protein
VLQVARSTSKCRVIPILAVCSGLLAFLRVLGGAWKATCPQRIDLPELGS